MCTGAYGTRLSNAAEPSASQPERRNKATGSEVRPLLQKPDVVCIIQVLVTRNNVNLIDERKVRDNFIYEYPIRRWQDCVAVKV